MFNVAGKFGVGFYSTFMVAEKVEVFSRPSDPDSPAHRWSSDGSGQYEITEAEGVQRGTKIILQLKQDCYDYSKNDMIKGKSKKAERLQKDLSYLHISFLFYFRLSV